VSGVVGAFTVRHYAAHDRVEVQQPGLPMADIFFSYKREDRTSIEPLVGLLEREGLTVWWDPDLVAGERFDEVINREIEQARCIVVAWSVNSTKAVWVRDEASTGRDRGILVPLSLDGARPPLGFGQFQTPNLSDWNGDPDDPRIRQLVAGVVRVVKNDGTALPALPVESDEPPRDLKNDRERPRVALGTGMSRRRLLGIGAAAGAALLTTAGGVWFAAPTLFGRSLPPIRTEECGLTTVDPHGNPNPTQPQSVDVFDIDVGSSVMQFAVIPAGGFDIGSPDTEPERQLNEGPQQFIELKKFAIGRTAVTQAQWAALVDASPAAVQQTLPRRPSFFMGDDLPVETVSWNVATEFCERLSRVTGCRMRLPSESEWEYACRARTTSAFHFGPTLTPELANYCGTGGAVRGTNQGEDISSPTYGDATYENGAYAEGPTGVFSGKTVPVATYPPNRFGLHEMHGNVWEHCADAGPVDYRQVPRDGTPNVGAQERHVLRGGSWSHNPAICRSAYRDAMRPDSYGWQGRVGLRVVCELDDE
jgi:formylglycine-generating enzyme required for sulfatase activity